MPTLVLFVVVVAGHLPSRPLVVILKLGVVAAAAFVVPVVAASVHS